MIFSPLLWKNPSPVGPYFAGPSKGLILFHHSETHRFTLPGSSSVLCSPLEDAEQAQPFL